MIIRPSGMIAGTKAVRPRKGAREGIQRIANFATSGGEIILG
jgi:hypothetical protein